MYPALRPTDDVPAQFRAIRQAADEPTIPPLPVAVRKRLQRKRLVEGRHNRLVQAVDTEQPDLGDAGYPGQLQVAPQRLGRHKAGLRPLAIVQHAEGWNEALAVALDAAAQHAGHL